MLTLVLTLSQFLLSYHPHALTDTLFMADPTIFYNKGTYYLYGTGGNSAKGFLVYTSSDMKNWKGPMGATDGYALIKGDTYGMRII